MSSHALANDFPAPSVPKAQGDDIHYSDMNGGVPILVLPYEGIQLGDHVTFRVKFDNANGPGWRVSVDQESQLTRGVVGVFDRFLLQGNTWAEVSFEVGPKRSDIRKYTLVF
ncbi:hypothetical protein KW846_17310 [Pseudomonas sp. PDM32]|uniref:hypothetical protein n=1 Tax=Pseudomonas sp. PDM32 TaxID=2854768 RepID=UPI001C43BB34|nr:hypothetical protein [Pseudomonas sp. PDM32]MBV7574463.1 hypothetical protein [Pseudomonas sp. PDM32]